MKYIIVNSYSLEGLEEVVDNHLKQGFLPVGSILVMTDKKRKNDEPSGWETVYTFSQPMVRTIPELGVLAIERFAMWDDLAMECSLRVEFRCTAKAPMVMDCNQDNCVKVN